ncbi:branched-chain amino acid--2-keto-4-methylthiobutyrate aminotransferase (plasmid) [Paroceanicella profunda]|uniref:Probable branched-chain-amino-acid aminotransferase n=1 Tax=Paroceanicella profunda TaxID=2579971 RepID=A0A5B8G2B3_9RHOB|nr:aminotransferase class IV [Paroceanicella profunda]QDL94214.1 branched-chain amino acid--2-keto-4-methylthiobutyrate aminotransferase [Paroceanicella profunda]
MTPTCENPYAAGAAYLDGRYMPVGEARIPVTDWGYRRSDVTYDVVGVWDGAFFRLDDHLRRFRRSMEALHMRPAESDAEIRAVLERIVALSGLRRAYVAMDCLRGAPPPGALRHPAFGRAYLSCYAVPWVSVASEEMATRGMHLMIPKVRRIPPESFDPRVKNFHWGDLTEGMFEARDAGADFAILLDGEGHVTEGAGFNVFSVTGGVVATPARGALEGVTRLSVMELCAELGLPLEVRDIPAEEFRAADEIFACTTAGGIMPAARIDGRIMGNDRPGPISTRLRDRFWQKRAEGWHATPVDYAAHAAVAEGGAG